jgi:hypothetical protein
LPGLDLHAMAKRWNSLDVAARQALVRRVAKTVTIRPDIPSLRGEARLDARIDVDWRS